MGYDHIWAPWRLGYILGEESGPEPMPAEKLLAEAVEECFLCQCAAIEPDKQWLSISRGEHSVVVLNRYPYNNGHLLIAPRRHVGRLDELSDQEHLELSRTITRMVGVLERAMRPEGFNVGLNLGRAAGAGLPGHLHWHIVPRWNGDTNFMSSVAAVRVMPQSLDAAWELLVKELAATKE